ncbi:Hha/YmoA family nucleoid-associated regulatory protein [Scandinavium sp. M-37]|uniref:Hha/YmoA family nucleoid-associated regulatory protein n=1 Tax=Scandinavium sp. M-37 TaxID=3373077 RepID=UPI0037464A52
MKSKMEYGRQLRRLNDATHLERVVDHMGGKLSADEGLILQAAADHRRTEMVMKQFF